MSELRISDDVGTEETVRGVEGGSKEHKVMGASATKGPVLVGSLHMGGNRVWCAKPTWMVLEVVHLGRHHRIKDFPWLVHAKSLMVLRFYFLSVLFYIYVHVPMSLRARASELDEWPENKVEKKYWISASHMLTGYSGWRATCWCGSVLSCSPFQKVVTPF